MCAEATVDLGRAAFCRCHATGRRRPNAFARYVGVPQCRQSHWLTASGAESSMDVSIRLPTHWLGASTAKGKGPKTLRAFVNTVMSYTKMDVPTVELYETAVTFTPKHADPLSAH